MYRLKKLLLEDGNNTKTFGEMYAGKRFDAEVMEMVSDPTYRCGNISVTIEHTGIKTFDLPTLLWKIPVEELGLSDPGMQTAAVADYCYRMLIPYIDELNAEIYNRNKPRNETGWYYMPSFGGEILERNTSFFDSSSESDCPVFCIRMQVQLTPKFIKKTIGMLVGTLPDAICRYADEFRIFHNEDVKKVVELSHKQNELREWLKTSGYCAFIANGSILPRDSKTGSKLEGAIPFAAPLEDEIEACGIKGMGIRKGVTVITGGGYSGKSTVLDAVSAGIYDHALGDGRELCITDSSAVTIAAEDGRCVKNLDISPFIRWIPDGNPEVFSTEHASGSTSQAANILEALDSGAKLLLMDEDRSATNFMIRDEMMRELIRREPIIPFTERVNEIYRECGLSTVLVIGGSGEYLNVADRVYLMDDYVMYNVTEQAKLLVAKRAQIQTCVYGEDGSSKNNGPEDSAPDVKGWKQNRVLTTSGFTAFPEGKLQERLEVTETGFILIGDERLDTRGVYGLICDEQRNALGFMLRILETTLNSPWENRESAERIDLVQMMDELYEKISKEGIDCVYSGNFPECGRNLALPRKQDFLAVIYRMRKTEYIDSI